MLSSISRYCALLLGLCTFCIAQDNSHVVQKVNNSPDTLGTINGAIADCISGMPIRDVMVTIENTGISTYTNTEGVFTIKQLVIGNYVIVFSKEGYASQKLHRMKSIGGLKTTCKIRMSLVKDLSLIYGTIYDKNTKNPIPWAKITFNRYNRNHNPDSVYTDSMGHYIISDMSPGNHSMQITHNDYKPFYLEKKINKGGYNLINVGLKK